MNNQELNNVIQNIKKNYVAKTAYIGFFYSEHDEFECFIKANKEGLMLFAKELIVASLEIDKRGFKEERELFYLSKDWMSNRSDINFSSIELHKKSNSEIQPAIVQHKQTWKDTLTGYLFGGVLIFILISILIGTVTIIGWVF